MLKEGNAAPGFTLPDQDEKEVSLKDYLGRVLVLYFYPKDNTPGCNMEAVDFTSLKPQFEKAGVAVVGVSRDSPRTHRNFIKGKALSLTLLSDKDATVHKLYDVWRPKKFMGREFVGTIRSTFLIGKDGKIMRVWDSVNPDGHAEEVLREAKKLAGK